MLHRACRATLAGGAARRRAPFARLSAAASPRPPYGVAFDIDGVLLVGPDVVPGAPEALQALTAAGVPYCFVTNGGGVSEAAKCAALEAKLGVPVSVDQMLLSHTPMKALAERYAGEQVLVVGSGEATYAVAREYGFDVVTCDMVHRKEPEIFPFRAPPAGEAAWDGKPLAAVLVMHDSVEWGADAQIVVDALVGGAPLGTAATDGAATEQAVPLYASNPDFVWKASYPAPRFAQRAFVDTVALLYAERTGGARLARTEFGKPTPGTYRFAERMLGGAAAPARIYAIGDNPAADIAGANAAGDHWTSVLVRTGIFAGGANDPLDPADIVVDDVGQAIAAIQAREAGRR